MKSIILILILTLHAVYSICQTPPILWQNDIGGDQADRWCIAIETSDGGYLIGGHSDSGISGDKTQACKGGADYWILKLDANGNIQWQKTIGSTGADYLYTMNETANGDFFLCGQSSYGISGDKTVSGNGVGQEIWIVRISATGSILWQKAIRGTTGMFSQYWGFTIGEPTLDGGFIVGSSSSVGVIGDKTVPHYNSSGSNPYIGFPNSDYWVIKLSASGAIEWQRDLGGASDEHLVSLHQTPDGGYVVGGSSVSGLSGNKTVDSIGMQDYWIVKLNASGNVQWQMTYGQPGFDEMTSLELTADSGFIVSGNTDDFESGFINCNTGYRILKLDSNGDLQWQKLMGSEGGMCGTVKQTIDGGYIVFSSSPNGIVCDKTVPNYGNADYWIIRLDSAGNIGWQHGLGGSEFEESYTGCVNADGTYIVAGSTWSHISGNKTDDIVGEIDFWIAKIGSDVALPLTVSSVVSDTVSCSITSCIADIDISVQGGTPPYIYIWNTGETTQDVIDICTGLSELTVTDSNGNSVTYSLLVNIMTNCSSPNNLSTNNISQTQGLIEWHSNDCAIKYRVRIKNMATGQTSLYFVNAPDTTKALSGLSPNTLYKVQVRSQCSSIGSILSQWSSPVYFTTLPSTGTVCVPPTNITATATSNSTATINWTNVIGANGYQLRYRINGTTTWIPIVINNGLATSTNITALQPNTAYQYQLRTKCSVSPLTWSNYSAVQTFTTPLRIGEEDLNLTVDLFPNPSSGMFTLSMVADKQGNATVDIISVDGKSIQRQNIALEKGTNGLQLDGSRWLAGLYFIKVACANGVRYQKVVLQ